MLAAPHRPSKPQVQVSENPFSEHALLQARPAGRAHEAYAVAVHWHNTRAAESRSRAHSS